MGGGRTLNFDLTNRQLPAIDILTVTTSLYSLQLTSIHAASDEL